ncbi:MAG: Radical domain protein [Hyphomicrobiales bacterium]|nr:Radical domain protein [Hyphomicrobiales bacterium]
MRVALVNPAWHFENSIYFGCREAHLPIELGACHGLLQQAGHEARMFDGLLDEADAQQLAHQVADFAPEMTVVTTAPTYLFWRCAPPELRAPREFIAALADRGGVIVAVGPHGSVTPKATVAKLGVDVVVMGECEDVIVALAQSPDWSKVASIAYQTAEGVRVQGGPAATRFTDLPALTWPDRWIARHSHHHHRFGTTPHGPGAEVEASRGCPYSCSFCAKIDYRDKYRKRSLDAVTTEIERLQEQGAQYIYFIDEIFLPQKPLLEWLVGRGLSFGVQTRIDLWKPDMLELLGRAGCVSIEAGVESLTREGRESLDKRCKLSTDELADLLVHARRHVPFVQANLIKTPNDDPALIRDWRKRLQSGGVWANDPVPLYPYPSSPDYRKLWGVPDDLAWERAHEHYLGQFDSFSDIQDERPMPLRELEAACRKP